MLHIISTNTLATLNYCQQSLQNGDSVLFTEEGVYWLMQNKIIQPQQEINYYALKDAVEARGIQQIPAYIKPIDYDRFVELTEIFPTNQVW